MMMVKQKISKTMGEKNRPLGRNDELENTKDWTR